MNIKKTIGILAIICILIVSLVGCGGTSGFDENKLITVVSREDGSGTRGAFIELMGIEEKGTNGTKIDRTTEEAIIGNKTDVILTNVAGDAQSIGYVSLGSLNDSIKTLKVDGVEPTAENVKNGTYKVARPFNIATKADVSDLAKDFINFILSSDGQKVVSEGYIPVKDDSPAYSGSKPSGKVVVAGSSSVTPIMEKLKEAYNKVNPNANIEVQLSDSTAGMTGAIEGTCDIGMASRNLKESEKEKLTATEIALDGIAMIVNTQNTFDNISSDDVKSIYIGEKEKWNEISK